MSAREWQKASGCGCSQEHRHILPASAKERPRTSENVFGRGSNGGVRCARKTDPMNDRATTLCASQRQIAVPTDEEARRQEPLTGATAIPRVDYGGESHCASPTTSEAFTLPKRCNRPPALNCSTVMTNVAMSGQLGCRESEPARQPSRLKDLTRDPNTRQVPGCLARGPTGSRPAGSQLAAPATRLRGAVVEPIYNADI